MSMEEDCRLISQNFFGALPDSASFLYHEPCFFDVSACIFEPSSGDS